MSKPIKYSKSLRGGYWATLPDGRMVRVFRTTVQDRRGPKVRWAAARDGMVTYGTTRDDAMTRWANKDHDRNGLYLSPERCARAIEAALRETEEDQK